MLSIQPINFRRAVMLQVIYKLKAYYHVFGTMIIYQFVALLFSFQGQYASTSINFTTVTTSIYSADIMISFTLLWLFTTSFYITNSASKNILLPFITNKQSNHAANFIMMLLFSFIGTVSAIGLGFTIRLGVVLYNGIENILFIDFFTMTELSITLFVTFLYHLLVFSFGYVIGEAIRLHRSFILLVPLLLFGLFMVGVIFLNDAILFTFFTMERSLYMFVIKVIVAVVIFWLIAFYIDRKKEVSSS